ncbi:MAG TPA: shikimate dehydrogenase [Chthoniobacterales bacterium]|jgi:shikimate dehydrogenase|nr:shikimate dehydrogenase [Chthoniobacterales bacterium]
MLCDDLVDESRLSSDPRSQMKSVYDLKELNRWETTAGQVAPPIRLGVVGDPVTHSLSPSMQNAALEKSGLEMHFAAFRIAPDELAEALELFRRHNFIGLNLTVPHKIPAVALVDEVEERAQMIGAINTIVFRDGKSSGWNTDAPGFERAVREVFSVDLRDLRVLLLGAGGGAGRAVAYQCAFEKCERLVLVNRTLNKAQALARELAGYFSGPRVLGPEARLEAVPWEEAALRTQLARTDLVVNATTLGLKRTDPLALPHSLLAPHLMIYDLVYKATTTPLLSAAQEAGARAADGLTMLLQQGALAFELWFDRAAPLPAMRAALRSLL